MADTIHIDAVTLAQEMIRLPSVTPKAQDSMAHLGALLEQLGFRVYHQTFTEEGFEPVPNLYARYGDASPNFCFAGHTDVVPAGNVAGWSNDPFSGAVEDGMLFGRGAADMKSAIAAFIAAFTRVRDTLSGSVSLLITGDEEGPAVNGTRKMLEWISEQGETLDFCLVGEPTNPEQLGDMIKIGRRGSLHATVFTHGIQGHVAYPHHAHNPIPDMVRLLATLEEPLDEGNGHFQPSNLEIVDMHVGNDSHNVIPATARAHFNVRFNTCWTPEGLQAELTRRLDSANVPYEIHWQLAGDAFITDKSALSDSVADAVERTTGRRPQLSTTGGTSDARFIKDYCPVVEFGLVGATMHKVDEHVETADIDMLVDIYADVIRTLVGFNE